jgi:hypothetical protein
VRRDASISAGFIALKIADVCWLVPEAQRLANIGKTEFMSEASEKFAFCRN